MKDLLKANGYRPAQGLRKLTWAQVKLIDQIIDQVCALTQRESGEAEVVIVVKNGHPLRIQRPVVTAELKPV